MNLLAWLTGSWKAGTWADGAWGGSAAPAAGGGGAPGKPKRKVYPTFYNPLPVIEPVRRPVEEAEALLLCGAV